jgi:DNA repair protein RadA/Sms
MRTWPVPISFIIVCWELFWIPSSSCWSTIGLQHTQRLQKWRSLSSNFGNDDDIIQTRRLNKIKTIIELNMNIDGNNDDDDEDEDDDEPPDVDIRNFRYPSSDSNSKNSGASFGLGRGRSSPSQRKAMGTSSKTSTTVFVCSNCGGESVQWRGRCPTCKEWNSFQEVTVQRDSSSSSSSSPIGGIAQDLLGRVGKEQRIGQQRRQPTSKKKYDNNNNDGESFKGQSWLDGISNTEYSTYDNNNMNNSNRLVSISDIDLQAPGSARMKIPNDDEMNQVLGGGLMKGSLILLGGDPGVGKSTLALQMAAQVASHLSVASTGIGMGPSPVTSSETAVGPVWYVSGEETLEQIASRAQRLLVADNDKNDSTKLTSIPKQLFLYTETNLNILADEVVQAWIAGQNNPSIYDDDERNLNGSSLTVLPPSLIVIDSIQTMVCEAGGSTSAGGISQVRESMALLLRLAKTTQIPILAIGHVTKSGDVAGPRMVEHMVDAVLYLEHSQSSASLQSDGNFRWLRAQKNRFGSCQTVGLYTFKEGILKPLPEGTESALVPPSEDLEGCAMGICVEGPHRAMTVEVQALVALPSGSFGKKTVEGGLSNARLNLLLGILQKHCQLPIAGGGSKGRDVYVNVVGCEGAVSKSQQALATMALDLAVTVALTSSYLRIPARGDTAFLAQVGLLGELRPLSSLESRLLQAQRAGFSRVIVAATKSSSSNKKFKRKTKSLTRSSEYVDEQEQGRRTRKFDLDIFECSTLKQALNLALVNPIPLRRPRPTREQRENTRSSKRTASPGSLNELNLEEEPILDDDDDEYD